MASANVRTLCAWGKAQYMDAIDVENRIAARAKYTCISRYRT